VEEIILMASQSGTKIVMASHDLGQVRRVAADVVFLVCGRLCEHASVDDFFDRPSSAEAAAFIQGELVL
ncbi:MAG: ABC transporter ATP-binding protein, partial [Mesorhizobium sp.]